MLATKEPAFHKLGIFVVGDLVRYYPRTYEDWSVTTPAAQAPEGTTVCVQATMVTPMRTPPDARA